MRFAALRVCEAFVGSVPTPDVAGGGPRAFVYLSAEDCNRLLVPAGYIETKREAGLGIERIMQDRPDFRGMYIRPSTSSRLSYICRLRA